MITTYQHQCPTHHHIHPWWHLSYPIKRSETESLNTKAAHQGKVCFSSHLKVQNPLPSFLCTKWWFCWWHQWWWWCEALDWRRSKVFHQIESWFLFLFQSSKPSPGVFFTLPPFLMTLAWQTSAYSAETKMLVKIEISDSSYTSMVIIIIIMIVLRKDIWGGKEPGNSRNRSNWLYAHFFLI